MAGSKKQFSVTEFFSKFISDSKSGKRKQLNGKLIRVSTIKNYDHTRKTLLWWEKHLHQKLLLPFPHNSKTSLANNTNKLIANFFSGYSEFLYKKMNYCDNSTGSNIKILKSFFNWLHSELNLPPNSYISKAIPPKGNVEIVALSPERLRFLICNEDFDQGLPERLKVFKDIFVFGCTIGLRVSDLLALKPSSFEFYNGSHYVRLRTGKTGTYVNIKLPEYAVKIMERYSSNTSNFFPHTSVSNFNNKIKLIAKLAGWTELKPKYREKQGVLIEIFTNKNKSFRFCDWLSSHTMRRTAISTMLCLGMPENYVRKISGHSDGSKEFYRYVEYAQSYIDSAIDIMFAKLLRNEKIAE
ncbi:MAG TPA: tyrosine-type recombinase/integrase [Bacteroidia bacterium]|nr:tyrosine-type recombinase/integrase [Bacteroidia bacterium]